MSEHSSSTANTDFSEFSNPPSRHYRLHNMSRPHHMTLVQPNLLTQHLHSTDAPQAEKHETIIALQQHRINTLIDLRRVEQEFATLNTPDVTGPMTTAWTYYVSSHSLLTELRALTRTYAFSSHCVDEAKRRVYADPESNRSWNLCWLVLKKIEDEYVVLFVWGWNGRG